MSIAFPLRTIAAATLLAAAPAAFAQQTSSAPAQAAVAPTADPFAGIPAPRADDVSSPEAILAALYASISGGVGEKRDWERFRSLFYPGAKLIPTGTPKGATTMRARMISPEDYVRTSGPFLERIGFRETEITRRIDRFGNIAHVFSTYDGRPSTSDMAPIRGINSIQLFNDGSRWWVVNIFWMQESEATPIPPAYLPSKR